MRKIEIGTDKYTKIFAIDNKEFNVNNEYEVQRADEKTCSEDNWITVFANIVFQKGPVKEVGVNGCHNEDLIAIVIDRLQGFQESKYKCRENAIAITKLEEALMWLNKRTQDRINKGIEGTSQI